jgi:hypothetical protein
MPAKNDYLITICNVEKNFIISPEREEREKHHQQQNLSLSLFSPENMKYTNTQREYCGN